ncbi:MAG: FAD-dependent oxidoreductase [Chloroflexi bacterium]|nr:MAG: FAD-dependent oxidoreductase [Chloroflexota bacterium]
MLRLFRWLYGDYQRFLDCTDNQELRKNLPIFIILLILAFILIFLGIRKIYYLSSDPTSEKDFFPHIHHKRKPLDEAPARLPFSQLGGTINDVSGVNRTSIYGILQIESEDELRNTLHFARQQKLTVSIAGAKHSMGGQEFATDALVLDMRGFNQMFVDVKSKLNTDGTKRSNMAPYS